MAIVFLLDEGQPVYVKPVDYGKAVAVHSGPDTDPNYATNMAFLLLGVQSRMETVAFSVISRTLVWRL